MVLVGEVGDAMDRTGSAMDAEAEPRDYPEIPDRGPSGVAALFQDPEAAREARENGRASSASRPGANARVARKTLRGQPQRVADLELF